MIILSHEIPISQEIRYVSFETKKTCEQIFLRAVYSVKDEKNFDKEDKQNLQSFSYTACQSKNPDIVWQIAYVESKFAMKVVGIPGQDSLYGNDAVKFLSTIKNNQNVDIGPLQINWKAHGSHSGYPAQYFMSGTLSLQYLSKFILGPIVKVCSENWVNCYNSGNRELGHKYRNKIDGADLELRRVLAEILQSKNFTIANNKS